MQAVEVMEQCIKERRIIQQLGKSLFWYAVKR